MTATRVNRRWPVVLLLFVVGAHQAQANQSGPAGAASMPQQVAASFVDPVRLERAHARLVRIAETLGPRVTLAELLTSVLTPDDVTEQATLADDHRAALLAVAFYVNRWPLQVLVPEAGTWPRATPRGVTLGGRGDHAQHFIVSAAMAAAVGSPFADAIAIAKEIRDSQRGSGFSFSDVVANRAGQRFGALASGSAASAARLAARLRSPLTDRDIMPVTTGLPGGLSDQEFARRYGAIGSADYNRIIADIDGRLDALELYR